MNSHFFRTHGLCAENLFPTPAKNALSRGRVVKDTFVTSHPRKGALFYGIAEKYFLPTPFFASSRGLTVRGALVASTSRKGGAFYEEADLWEWRATGTHGAGRFLG